MGRLPRETDIVVVGGGPAGVAAAIAARQKGFRVTLVDPERPPIDKACGEGLMPDSLAALRNLGIQIGASDGRPFRGIRFLDSGMSLEAEFPLGAGLGVRRTTLQNLMVDRAAAAGVTMLWGNRATGITPAGVRVASQLIRCRWTVGADGVNSQVRRWAGLDGRREKRRFGYRRHYSIEPWTDYMELYWGAGCQIYVTPVEPEKVCVVLVSRDPHLRLDDAIPRCPELLHRLRGASPAAAERGAITASCKLRSVYRDGVALAGDASGSVDAIAGEGLCLAFRQATALAGALACGDLAGYQAEHKRIASRPELMAQLLLTLDRRERLRRRVFRALASRPDLFAKMLAMHVGALSLFRAGTGGIELGWRMLTA